MKGEMAGYGIFGHSEERRPILVLDTTVPVLKYR